MLNQLRKGSENINESPGGDANDIGLSFTENSILFNNDMSSPEA